MVLFLLYENASGYALFEHVKSDAVSAKLDQQVADVALLSKVVKLKAFVPFTSAETALGEINEISEGSLTATLSQFLELNLPKVKKDKDEKVVLGVTDTKLGNAISEVMGIKCRSNDEILELLRGIRMHFHRFIKNLKSADLQQAQLGLGHAYSRGKVKFNVHRVDNMIIQAIALLDQLDKDINTFSMRVREWYSWHFPELIGIVKENHLFAKLATIIKNKSTLSESRLGEIEEVIGDTDKAKQVLEAAKHSMGTDLSSIDMVNIEQFASRVVSLAQYRKNLHEYLIAKMNAIAPNLSALIGEQVAARLIAHAGSLTNLAKYPASTVQILGAEKALFRALKTRGNTPKYGLIFHSSFIGRAPPAVKGRISRYLANKCSIACRLDSFGDVSSNVFGEKMRDQVEARLEFYKTGKQPKKNVDVMTEAINIYKKQTEDGEDHHPNGVKLEEKDDDAMETEDVSEKKKKKKEKKAKKEKREREEEEEEEQPTKKAKQEDDSDEEAKKKKKKEKKKKAKKDSDDE